MRKIDDDARAPAVLVEAFYRGVLIDARQVALLARRGPRARPAAYRVGAVTGVDAPLPTDERMEHPLLEEVGDGFVVAVLPGMHGEVTRGADVTPLDRWVALHGARFRLPEDAHVRLERGAMTYAVARTARAPLVPRPWTTLRWRDHRYTVASGAALLLLTLLAWFVPPDARALSLRHVHAELRFAPTLVKPPEERPQPAAGGTRAGGAPPQRPAAPRPSRPPPSRRSAERPSRDRPAPPRPDAGGDPARAGILGLLSTPDGALDSVLGQGSALADADALADLRGDDLGSAYAIGGIALRGTGAGGAGTGQGTIGTGALGTIGAGGGHRASDYGTGVGSLGRRRARAPEAIAGLPSVRGALDRDIIRRTVRRHINEVRYCYEKELTGAPALGGRVSISFTIAATGLVSAAFVQNTTMGHPRVEACVVAAVRRWEFPRPEGGGVVIATYPFAFVTAAAP